MKLKKIISAILLILIIFVILYFMLKSNEMLSIKDDEKKTIVVTTFSAYDFVRQIAGDKVNLIFLLGPGIDSHGYEPKAKDIVEIQKSDLFIYVGGTIEPWSSKIKENLSKTDTLRLIDCIDLKEEIKIDGTESSTSEPINEREYDEHIWTSLDNSIKMINYIENKLSSIDSKSASFYKENSEKYIEKISNLKKEFEDTIKNSKRKRLVFGDKMPMQYFIEEFGLEVSAAFNGCSEETVPTSRTISYLIDLIKKEKIPVILYLELNEGKVAKTLSEETGAKVRRFQSLHNISKEDFENGETYVSLMERNLKVIKEALN